ncbi:MAG: hypothetical protein P8Y66_06420 [Nitrospirota bacterium]|jgi:hypothetical protein
MKRDLLREKKFSETTGKLHLPCPHEGRSGICVHVVLRDGCCYRSDQCLVMDCKYNSTQSDLRKILSLTW